ncbi:MAG: protein translocase subunit SecD [Planctomycetaceae bacterium]|nr:protein translocase subunit SecD [Planctomycetaceae bacterium]
MPALLLAFQDTVSKSADGAVEAADTVATQTTATAADSSASGWVLFLVVVAMLVLPFVIGQALAKAMRLKDLSFKFGIVLFSLTLGLAPFVAQKLAGHPLSDALNWGIDLAGGTNMVFAVDHQGAEDLQKSVDPNTMQRMVEAIGRRVNPSGTEEVTVRQVGRDRIEVIIPGADPEKVDRIKRQITKLGSLEFGLLANEYEHSALIQEARSLPNNVDELRRGNVLRAKWRAPGEDPKTKEIKPVSEEYGVAARTVERGGKSVRQFLVVVEEDPKRRITGQLLRRAFEEIGQSGAPVVGFEFNTQGGYLFQRLTAAHMPKEGAGYKTRLAILLNDEIHSAPSINDMIGARGIIEGDFDAAELNELINVLNAGALDVPLFPEPVSEFTVSPLLGIDVQTRGIRAILIATVAVFVVTAGYYLIAGAVADVCLALNIILLMGSMALIDATFTLPGLAGVALAIGMAVDANVLIFERMREEQQKGSSLRMSIHNGFSKALSAIIDSNVTTMITAIVLYIFGSEQVKGFAVTLFIGLVWNMFCAVYVARLIFDVAERKRWLKTIRMFSLIEPQNVDFVGKTRLAVGGSLLLMAVGLGALFLRGRDNLDIDFRGGSMVTFRFEGDAPSSDEVREALDKQFESSISLESLRLSEDAGAGDVLFRLRTVEDNVEEVGKQVVAAFADSSHHLVQQSLQYGDVAPIPAEAPEGTPANDFAGGEQVEVTLAQPILAASLSERLVDGLQSLRPAGTDASPYPDATDLLRVTPKEGESTDKASVFVVEARQSVAADDLKSVLAESKQQFESEPAFEEKTTFDPAVAGDTQRSAFVAVVLSNLAIIFYLWFRFHQAQFGIAAVVAVMHDVMIVLGLVAIGALLSNTPVGPYLGLTDFKIDLSIVAAFLTIIGYSLNDTIVVFDRIREVRGKNPAITEQMINLSLNQTLSRTLLTSSTTLIVLLILYVLGGEGVHGFSYCMFLGIIVGTFSSIYIASPVLLWLARRELATNARSLRPVTAG